MKTIYNYTQNNGISLISVLGIIDGGTWEHRKRAREMLETAQKNNLQSIAGRGNHFMGDFLPVSTAARTLRCFFLFIIDLLIY